MEDSQALQIAISSITGVLVPKTKAEKIIEAWNVIKVSPDSTTIKQLKDLGCACYGNNSVHPCFCSKPLNKKLK
jgi:hypothetical protein